MFYIYGFDPEHFKCAPCINAKRLCEQRGWEYKFIPVSSGVTPDGVEFNEEIIDCILFLLEREDRKGLTMPQIFYSPSSRQDNVVHVGGFTELRTFKYE